MIKPWQQIKEYHASKVQKEGQTPKVTAGLWNETTGGLWGMQDVDNLAPQAKEDYWDMLGDYDVADDSYSRERPAFPPPSSDVKASALHGDVPMHIDPPLRQQPIPEPPGLWNPAQAAPMAAEAVPSVERMAAGSAATGTLGVVGEAAGVVGEAAGVGLGVAGVGLGVAGAEVAGDLVEMIRGAMKSPKGSIQSYLPGKAGGTAVDEGAYMQSILSALNKSAGSRSRM